MTDLITLPRARLQQWMEAFRMCVPMDGKHAEVDAAFRDLRAALEQPEQEPLEQPEQEPRNVEEIAADFGREFAQTFSGKRTEPQPEQADAEAALRFALAQRDWAFKQLQAQPDRREWRSLSEEEMHGLYRRAGLEAYLIYPRDGMVQYDCERQFDAYARAIEAALRSKNHG
jgi:hypothetical protein